MSGTARVLAGIACALACLAGARAQEPLTLQEPRRQLDRDPSETGPGARRVLFELRLAENEPVRGLAFEATVKGRKIYLHYATLLTNNDIEKAAVVERSGKVVIALTLDSDGAGKMTAATTKHVGRPLAVVLDGEIASILTVRAPIGRDFVFETDLTPADAARIASGLQRW